MINKFLLINTSIVKVLFLFSVLFCYWIFNIAKAQTCVTPTALIYGTPLLNQTTCGMENNFNQYHACGNRYINGEEHVFSYTPTTAGLDDCISITVSGTNVNSSLFVFDGCPDALSTNCIAQSVSNLTRKLSIDNLNLNL